MPETSPRKPSSIDVARAASVSQATVSYVLNGKSAGLVSDETRERVLAAARKVGYRPNSLAKALLKGRTNTIGVFVSFLGSRYHADIVLGAQEVLEEHGYSLLLTASETDHKARASRISFMMNHRVDAILLVGGFYEDMTQPLCLNEAVAERLPCVVVDDAYAHSTVDCVVSDDSQGLALAVNHLKSFGHSRIAYLPAPWKGTTADARINGYIRAMTAAGLDVMPELYAPPAGAGDEIANLALELLRQPNRPTALIAANDHMLGYTVRALRELNLSTPDDVALVGYGNQEIAMVMELTSVDQQPRLMGKSAALRLLARLEQGDMPHQTIQTPVKLVVRASTVGEAQP
ncbi:MAG: LacI family DNA-binding transcriptional regulator [Capsulimonadaceae bacterium]|nr:LacI family DNA-binding transcriptional regulator [Capsulimonadaceae bacterium]